MRTDAFDFELPEALIALRPVHPRRSARLLVARPDRIADAHVAALPDLLDPGDLLVFNDTKVIPARLRGARRRASRDGAGFAQIEVTLLARLDTASWRALAKPAKRLSPGDRILFEGLQAEVAERAGGVVVLRFDLTGAALDARIAEIGVMPLPPYIARRRAADARDETDYQTVFARALGSVAAPTASLHFDRTLLDGLAAAGIARTTVTLHVGAGTFLPVTAETLNGHKMHAEWGQVPDSAVAAMQAARARGRRVVPVGTTALRLIETAAAQPGGLASWKGETDIFITPGFNFRAADGLMTNFHLPRSTLMMLVSALMGVERIRAIYAHAIDRRYRFYSYGDASLLLP
ncbi:MAG: tRNA preQ1(34) S-adenosylmethionine ribosyltransferase-isomerase QueA [Pseudomonadota bacterium]